MWTCLWGMDTHIFKCMMDWLKKVKTESVWLSCPDLVSFVSSYEEHEWNHTLLALMKSKRLLTYVLECYRSKSCLFLSYSFPDILSSLFYPFDHVAENMSSALTYLHIVPCIYTRNIYTRNIYTSSMLFWSEYKFRE